jgi:carbonic anhydrase/acetyltransferase-like protein (isoleucine patch superfamily)
VLIEHDGGKPRVDSSAYVAPTAVLCGDVAVGPGSRVLFGAVLVADGGPVVIGESTIIMENAVVRGRPAYPVRIGDHVLVGPHAHINGAMIEDCAFIATGASVFPGAVIEARATVRINAVVHIKTRLPADRFVPIGWIALGDPLQILPPDAEPQITELLRQLDFASTVLGVQRKEGLASVMPAAMKGYSDWFGSHARDRPMVGDGDDN